MSDRAAAGPRIIVALDHARSADALALATRLDPARCRVKVGKELFTREGPDVVRELTRRGFGVFLDLKFHDIPNTVAGACRAAADLGVWMLDVHAAGGRAMLEAARDAVRSGSERPPLLVAVTVLTSLDEEDLAQTGIADVPAVQVERLVRLAGEAGLDGVVCSVDDLDVVHGAAPAGFLAITPGIRPAGADHGDQKRVATPVLARARGADYLVVGRPIATAADPLAALGAIEEEMQAGGGRS